MNVDSIKAKRAQAGASVDADRPAGGVAGRKARPRATGFNSKANDTRSGSVEMQLARMLRLADQPGVTPEVRQMVQEMHDRMYQTWQNALRAWI